MEWTALLLQVIHGSNTRAARDNEDFKLEKGPTDKAKEPDPGGPHQQNLGFKKLKNRKTGRTVGMKKSGRA